MHPLPIYCQTPWQIIIIIIIIIISLVHVYDLCGEKVNNLCTVSYFLAHTPLRSASAAQKAKAAVKLCYFEIYFAISNERIFGQAPPLTWAAENWLVCGSGSVGCNDWASKTASQTSEKSFPAPYSPPCSSHPETGFINFSGWCQSPAAAFTTAHQWINISEEVSSPFCPTSG